MKQFLVSIILENKLNTMLVHISASDENEVRKILTEKYEGATITSIIKK